jgi:choloylglycine hydrolase
MAILGPLASWIPVHAQTGRLDVAGLQCTAFCLRGRGNVVVGKNLDWPVEDGLVVVNKRGTEKQSWVPHGATPLTWVSRFGSLTFNQFGREFPLGGINEMGLVVEELSYWPARYPSPDQRPAVNELQWIQYQLDQSSSVEDVLASDRELRIRPYLFGLHYLVADSSGRVAVVEFLDGKRLVYTGDSLIVPVLANDTYANLVKYLGFHSGFGGDRVVSDGPESPERFVRAATRVRNYEQDVLSEDPATYAFGVLESVRQSDTQWHIVYDLTHRAVHFRTRSIPDLRTIYLDSLDLDCRSPIRVMSLSEEVRGVSRDSLQVWSVAQNRSLLEGVFSRLESVLEPELLPPRDIIEAQIRYPESTTCPLPGPTGD